MKIPFSKFTTLVGIMLVFLACLIPAYGQPDPMQIWKNSSEKKSGPKPMTSSSNKKVIQSARNGSRKSTLSNRKIEIEKLFNAGNAALARKDFSNAEEAFRKTLTYDSQYAGGYEGLGVVSYRQGCYDDAIKFFDKAGDLDKKTGLPDFNLGASYFSKGNYEVAASYYKQAISLNPKSLNARIELARTYSETEDLESAEKLFKEIIALNPKSYDVAKAFSDFYLDQNNYEKAELLIKPFANSPDAIERANTYEWLGRIEVTKGNGKEAISYFKDAIRENPHNSGSYYFYIGITFFRDSSKKFRADDIESVMDYAKMTERYREAEGYFKKAILRNYVEPEVYYFLGLTLSVQLRFEEAKIEINKGLSIFSQNSGKGQSANSKCPDTFNSECENCSAAFGKFVLGLTYFIKSAMLEDTDDEASAKLNMENAIKAFEEMVVYETRLNAIAYRMLSSAFSMSGDEKKAISYGELAILNEHSCEGCFSNDFQFYTTLGLAYLEESRLLEAAIMFRKSIKINPAVSETHFDLALVLEKQNLPSDARKEYLEAISLDPEYEAARLMLGQLLTTIGDKEGALEQYKALRLLNADSAKFLLQQINQKFPPNP